MARVPGHQRAASRGGVSLWGAGLALGSEGGLACRLSQLLWVPVSGRAPHCEPGPEALQ